MPEKTHWKSLTNPNYLGAYSLPGGKDIIVTIDFVKREQVVGANGNKKFEVVAHLKNGFLPFILNKTNMKTIQKLYGSPYIEDWSGRAIQVYFDPKMKFGSETVGGLRIRPTIPKQDKLPAICADCGKPISPTEKFSAEQLAEMAYRKYGKPLCISCGQAEKAKLEAGKSTAEAAARGKPE